MSLVERFKKLKKEHVIIISIVAVMLLTAIIACVFMFGEKKITKSSNPEIARSMTYTEVQTGDDNVSETNFVKFDAFFTRDLTGDGYANKLRGACRNINQRDTLYFSINVLTEGYLKDAKIEIAGTNIKLQTGIVADSVVRENLITDDAKTINLNQMSAGTQKLFSGIINADIKNNINNYSRSDNKIILTGTYVTNGGQEIPIRKEVEFIVDWYGEVETNLRITTGGSTIKNYFSTLESTETQINAKFRIITEEKKEQLIISNQTTTFEFPELNGYLPVKAIATNTTHTSNYNTNTGMLTVTRDAGVDGQGDITSTIARNTYLDIVVSYPIEAYQIESGEDIVLTIPIRSYNEGFNNQNEEFSNPIRSNIAEKTIQVIYTEEGSLYNMTVGKYVYRQEPYFLRIYCIKRKTN